EAGAVRMYLEPGADLGERGRDGGEPDVLLQPRGVAGRGHLPDHRAVVVDGEGIDHRAVVVAAQRLPADLEAHELAPRSLRLEAAQGVLADEVRLLLEGDHPVVAHADL